MKTFAQTVKQKIQIDESVYQKSPDDVSIMIYDILDSLPGEQKTSGIGLKAPETIAENELQTKRIFFIASFTGSRQRECTFNRNKILLLINNNSGKIIFTPFYDNTKRINFTKIPLQTASNENQDTSLHQTICEGYTLGMLFPKEYCGGAFTSYALYYDWISEPAAIQIPSNSIETIFPLFSNACQASAVITKSLTKQRKNEEQYAIEISDSIDMASDSLPAKISFSVNIKKEWLNFQWDENKKPVPKALIPVSVFVTKHNQDQKTPVCWQWTVPVYSSEKVNVGDRAEGFLITDLFHEEYDIKVEREFLAWSVVGTHLLGPERFVIKSK
jgi:hypothetical protein